MLASSLSLSRFAWIGVTSMILSGCSPMYQSVYDGDVRFEHCYRVDEERQIPIGDKLQCWRDWSHRYKYGQSRDRIGYALARERTLAQAMAAGERAAPRGAGGTEAQQALPQPTNAYVPPPQTMTPASATADGPGAHAHAHAHAHATRNGAATDANGMASNGEAASLAASAAHETPLTDAPGASCGGACSKTWSNCRQPCKGATCRSTCDDQYRTCMRACF